MRQVSRHPWVDRFNRVGLSCVLVLVALVMFQLHFEYLEQCTLARGKGLMDRFVEYAEANTFKLGYSFFPVMLVLIGTMIFALRFTGLISSALVAAIHATIIASLLCSVELTLIAADASPFTLYKRHIAPRLG
jgi:hypothetical protein